MQPKPFPPLFFSILKVGWLTVFLLLLGVKNGTGQVLNADLTFKPSNSKELYNETQKILPVNTYYTEQEKKQLKKLLLERVEETLLNLEDQSTGLADDYKAIWNSTFLTSYKCELKMLRQYLKEPDADLFIADCPSVAFLYVPSPDSIDQLLKEPVSQVVKGSSENGFTEWKVLKKDLLKEFLLDNYNFSIKHDNHSWKKGMDIAYIKDWRSIEGEYEKLLQIRQNASAIRNDIFSYDVDSIDHLLSKVADIHLPNNDIVQRIKGSHFTKKWLWYTGGTINMNPLLVTSASKRYPYTEKNSFFTAEKQRMQDSLNKMPILDHFRQSEYVFNRVRLPVSSPQEEGLKFRLIEYNAMKNYTTRNKSGEKYLDNGQRLKIAIHNIPANTVVTPKYGQDKLTYESAAISQLNTLADQIAVVTNLGVAHKGAFTKVIDFLEPQTLARVQNRQVGISHATDGVSKHIDTFSWDNKKWDMNITNPFIPRQFQVQIGDQVVPLTGTDLQEDKRRIMWASAAADFKDRDLAFFDKAVEAFIKKDRANFLDYTNDSTLVKTACKLKNSFIDYLKIELTVRFNCVNLLLGDIENKMNTVLPFVRIYNRSLPEVELKAGVDSSARYYTRVLVPEIPEAPRIFKYTLIEEKGKSAAREVAHKEFKVVKSVKFDFSVGLGANFRSYTISHSSGTALPVAEEGKQFQFVGGAHWYPFGRLNKLNDRFWGKPKERFSVYAGLSLQNALDNYYLGVSYDVWPGVKLIYAGHLYRNQSFKIVNNAVAQKAFGIECAGSFLSVNIEPATLGKAIGLFK